MKKIVMAMALGLCACGSPSGDTGGTGGGSGGGNPSVSPGAANVAACKSLIDKLNCGTAANPLSSQGCDGYLNTTCDITDYFSCLEGAYVCVNGTYDVNKLATAGSCASKATCL